MHPDLKTRRRLFVQASQGYTAADFAWRKALGHARTFVPGAVSRKVSTIGAPGSRMRRLYEARDKALHRLQVAHLKLDVARTRLADQA